MKEVGRVREHSEQLCLNEFPHHLAKFHGQVYSELATGRIAGASDHKPVQAGQVKIKIVPTVQVSSTDGQPPQLNRHASFLLIVIEKESVLLYTLILLSNALHIDPPLKCFTH
jgi:hypothetical protein